MLTDFITAHRVKEVTEKLKKRCYPHPECLSLLLRLVLSVEKSPAQRQLAATQARRLVPKHWRSLALGEKESLRQELLQITFSEEGKLLSHAFAQVVAAIAKLDLEDQQWPRLLPTLQHAALQEGNPTLRESSTFILFTILEAFGTEITHMFGDMLKLFSKTLNDPVSAEVRINTMLALSMMAMALDPASDEESLERLQETIPQMVMVLKEAVETKDDERTATSFEVFQTLLGCDSAVLNQCFGHLIQLMLELATTKSFTDDARTQAICFLMQCVRYRKLKVQGLRLGPQITLACLEIATEVEDGSQEDEDATPARSALGLLDILASSLPPSQVVIPLINALAPYVNSPDPDRRQGGIMALSMCVEGAPDFVATQLDEICLLVLRLLGDPEAKVRRAALDGALGLAQELAENLGKVHTKRLISALVAGLDAAFTCLEGEEDEANIDIICTSCLAIDSSLAGLTSDEVGQYLPELVPRLSRLLEHPSLKIKSAAIGAWGAAAENAKEAFLPYFQQSMNSLFEYHRIKYSLEELDLRCTTCDALASIAFAVGPEPFRRYVQTLMEATMEGLHLDHPKLKETSYWFWSAMAKVYRNDFKPFLGGVLNALFRCLEADESEHELELGELVASLARPKITGGGRDRTGAAANADNESDDPDDMDSAPESDDGDDQDEDDDDWDDLTAVSAVAQEKEIAVEVMGDVLTHTTREYLPHIWETVEAVLPLAQHSYEGLRRAAAGTLFRTYAAVWEVQEGQLAEWKPGLPLQVQPGDEITRLGDMIMNATLPVWQEEDDRYVFICHCLVIFHHSHGIFFFTMLS